MKIKLPVAFKRKWVAALRSKKYKQGKSWLRIGDGYCCLGVGADVLDPKDWKQHQPSQSWKWRRRASSTLAVGLRETDKTEKKIKLALEQIQPQSRESFSVEGFLVENNDHKGWGFKRIANWIEKNL